MRAGGLEGCSQITVIALINANRVCIYICCNDPSYQFVILSISFATGYKVGSLGRLFYDFIVCQLKSAFVIVKPLHCISDCDYFVSDCAGLSLPAVIRKNTPNPTWYSAQTTPNYLFT